MARLAGRGGVEFVSPTPTSSTAFRSYCLFPSIYIHMGTRRSSLPKGHPHRYVLPGTS